MEKIIMALPKETMQDIYDAIYPVGSKYIGFSAPNIPNNVTASWVKDDTYNNKALWVDNSQTPGTELAGSLPNITGKATTARMNTGFGNLGNSGAIYGELNSTSNCIGWIAEGNNQSFCFDASRSNSVYGAAAGTNVVRPTSVVINVWKREA